MSDFYGELTGDQYGRLVQVVDGYFFDGFGNPLDIGGGGGQVVSGGSASFMLMEVQVTGIKNSSNRTFTLTPSVDISGTNLFFINGQLMTQGSDYTFIATSVTISSYIPAPDPDDILRFFTSVMVVNTNGIAVQENGTSKITGATTLNMIGATVVNSGTGIATITISGVSSDRRLKDDIKPIENPIEKIKKISGNTFTWNDKQDEYTGYDIGVIAQEIEEILPQVVTTRDNGYKVVKYEKIVPLLIEAIKEQQLQIDELRRELDNR